MRPSRPLDYLDGAEAVVEPFFCRARPSLAAIFDKNEFAQFTGHLRDRQPWQAGGAMHANPSFPVRYYLHGDLSDDGSGRAFCARCGGFHAPDHFDDLFHAMIKSAKLAQSVGSWMHNAANPSSGARRPEGSPNLFQADLGAIAESVHCPKWAR